MTCHNENLQGPTHQSFFWYDNDKDLLRQVFAAHIPYRNFVPCTKSNHPGNFLFYINQYKSVITPERFTLRPWQKIAQLPKSWHLSTDWAKKQLVATILLPNVQKPKALASIMFFCRKAKQFFLWKGKNFHFCAHNNEEITAKFARVGFRILYRKCWVLRLLCHATTIKYYCIHLEKSLHWGKWRSCGQTGKSSFPRLKCSVACVYTALHCSVPWSTLFHSLGYTSSIYW